MRKRRTKTPLAVSVMSHRNLSNQSPLREMTSLLVESIACEVEQDTVTDVVDARERLLGERERERHETQKRNVYDDK